MILYEKDRGLYLNLTNRCPVSCSFCIKMPWDYQFEGHDLRIKGPEPTAPALIAALKEKLDTSDYWREVVYCGFGESTYRLEEMKKVGLYLKTQHPELRQRLNTADEKQWVELMHPAPAYRTSGFAASRLFAERCVAARIKTRITAVELPEVDLAPLQSYARKIKADFIARPVLA